MRRVALLTGMAQLGLRALDHRGLGLGQLGLFLAGGGLQVTLVIQLEYSRGEQAFELAVHVLGLLRACSGSHLDLLWVPPWDPPGGLWEPSGSRVSGKSGRVSDPPRP